MSLQEQIAEMRYNEALLKPKMEKSLDNLIARYGELITAYHVTTLPELLGLVEDAYRENDELIIQRESGGYFVAVFKT